MAIAPRYSNELNLGHVLQILAVVGTLSSWFFGVYVKQQDQISTETVALAVLNGRMTAIEGAQAQAGKDHDILTTIATQLDDLKRQLKR